MKSPKELLRSLLTDVKRLEPDVKGLERDLNTLELRFEHEGFSFFAVTLASLCDALDRGLASGCFACPSGFKKIRSGALPVFLQGLLCKVFDAKTGHLLECPSTGAIKCLRETLRLFKKTRDDSDREDILDRLACDEFVKTDENASSFILSSRHLDLLDRVSRSVLPYLRLRDLGESTFKHGPGGVYERVVGNQKWLTLVDELRKESDYMEQFGYSDFVSTMVLGDITTPWTETIQQPTCLDAYKRASSGIARLVTVAKNSTSRRTITVEPLLNQFVQQGLNTVLREEISRCTILNRCLALTDQSKNQKLARIGSLTDEWSTLDLKSASDLMSSALVRIVFRDHIAFYRAMVSCRTPEVELPNSKAILLHKFAGMGNALTFPVQSVVFAVVAISAILDAWGKPPRRGWLKRAASMIRVYGDDIIVRKEHARQVASWLQLVGLKINEKKSFFEGNFKESCGVDAWRGDDVTPLYIKYRPDIASPGPNAIASWVSASNHAWERGLYSLSTVLRELVEKCLKRHLPLVSRKSGALGWHTRTGTSQLGRWNKQLHRFEVRSPVLIPKERNDKLDGYAALLKFFHREVKDLYASDPTYVDPMHLEKSQRRFHLRLATRWVPV